MLIRVIFLLGGGGGGGGCGTFYFEAVVEQEKAVDAVRNTLFLTSVAWVKGGGVVKKVQNLKLLLCIMVANKLLLLQGCVSGRRRRLWTRPRPSNCCYNGCK